MSTETTEQIKGVLSGWIAPVATLIIGVMISIIGFLAKDKVQTIISNQNELKLQFSEIQKIQQQQQVFYSQYDGRLHAVEDGQKQIVSAQEKMSNELTDLKVDFAMKFH